MTTDVKVPASGESVTTANVARWHQRNGESVRKGDVLVTLETDKVSNELEAAHDGVLEILVGEGEEVAIGTLIARLTATAGTAPTPPVSPAPATGSPPAPPAASGQSVEIKVPAAGESIATATVASWRRKDGDSVAAGEIIVVLETDKVSNELESPVAGRLAILVPEGEEVAVGSVIARVEAAAPVPAPATAAVPKTAVPPVAVPATKETGAAPGPTLPISAPRPDFTPAPAESAGAAVIRDGRTTRRKMSMLRRKIATQLVNAQQTAAILTTFNEVDMSAVMALRKSVQEEFLAKHGVKLGFMSFFVKAVVQALQEIPAINARIDGQDIIENHFYDIGVAIGMEKGLVVPVLRDVDRKSFARIEQDILDYASRAREGRIVIDDLQGGVFSISNGGTYGSLLSTPIVNPPQSAILGMHAIQQRPVAVDGQVVIRPMMYLALSYDHRLIDGKEAVTFLIHIKNRIENPARLLLET